MENLREKILIYALDNARKFDGKASLGPVMGKIMSEFPQLRKNAKDIKGLIQEVIIQVNSLSIDEQIAKLEQLAPEMLKKVKGERKIELPPLPDATDGKVITRFPPEPNGYLHIGHAYSALINYLYSVKYQGKLILRFEDTNPRGEKLEFYDMIKDGLKWLGITWDEEKRVSDDIPLIYDYAKKLIENSELYACDCPVDTVRKNRQQGVACRCRENPPEKNMEIFEKMLQRRFKEGEVIIRLKGNMESQNYVMRDPTMLRIIDSVHPVHQLKYYVYPTYDFAVAIEDALCGITHVLRSNEFQPRIELQNYIRKLLNLPNPKIIQYSRFSVEGTPTSKRKIKELIENGIVSGWDDPRLATLVALKRRGILPQTLRDLTIQVGPSTAEPVISWELINSLNRKNLDPIAERYFVVKDPIELIIDPAPKRTVKLKKHPSKPEMGYRTMETNSMFYIQKDDISSIKEGDIIRLKDLYNIRIISIKERRIEASFEGDSLKKDIIKIHWVPRDYSINIKLFIPDTLIKKDGSINEDSLRVYRCMGEKELKFVETGSIIQMERIGFARVDKKDETGIDLIMS